MNADHPSSSAGRITRMAIGLVLPLVLSAAAMPWILGKLRPGVGPSPSASSEQTRRPEAPTASEIEIATKSGIDAARLQERNIASSTFFAPREARVGAEGERLIPFRGFGVSVGSTPGGARVIVSGREVGETPIVASVDCEPGLDVEVRLEKAGFRMVRRVVRCRADALLELSVTLRP